MSKGKSRIETFLCKIKCGSGKLLVSCTKWCVFGPLVKQIMDHPWCAQLCDGDIILEVNREKVNNYLHSDLVTILKRCAEGNQATLRQPAKVHKTCISPCHVFLWSSPISFPSHVLSHFPFRSSPISFPSHVLSHFPFRSSPISFPSHVLSHFPFRSSPISFPSHVLSHFPFRSSPISFPSHVLSHFPFRSSPISFPSHVLSHFPFLHISPACSSPRSAPPDCQRSVALILLV